MLKRLAISALTAITMALAGHAITLDRVHFNNITADTTRINNILIEAQKQGLTTPSQRVEWLAKQFIDTPYEANTLISSPETLTVNLDGMDCTTYVENVLALAYTLGERRTAWQDFLYNLERLRYRGGSIGDYASRLHYFSDWVVDNAHRGNIIDATLLLPAYSYAVKTLSYMSENASLYPALADSTTLAAILTVEEGYHNHRFPYVKSTNINSRDVRQALRSGDVIAFTTRTPTLDVSHLAIILIDTDGTPRIIHASSAAHKVTIDNLTLADYLRRNRNVTGFRIVRLKD
jgi:hypothetical protein